MDKAELQSALEYYGYGNINVQELFDCIDEINEKHTSSVKKVIEQMYYGPYGELENLYGNYCSSLMFGEEVPNLTAFAVLLAGAKEHKKSVIKYNFDKEQIDEQMSRIKECGDIVLNSGNTTALAWSANFARGRLLQIGRLQFQYLCGRGDNTTVHIHIPGGEPLSHSAVLDAIKESGILLKKYYGITNAVFKCDSWLLSPELQNFLKSESNIRLFADMFDVTEGPDAKRDIIWNLYHTTDMNAELEQKTSLQISIKKALDSGVIFHEGIGILKKDFIPELK